MPSARGPSAPAKKSAAADVSDSDSSEEEPEGHSTFSDNDMDVDKPENVHQVPEPARAATGKIKGARGRSEFIMMPEECRAHLRRVFGNEPVICSLLFGRHGPFAPISKEGYSWASADIFFLDVIPVPPTRFRPPAKLGETLFEHPQNELLTKVLTTCVRLRDIQRDIQATVQKESSVGEDAKRKLLGAMTESLIVLQNDVNSFVDSSKNPQPMRQGMLPPSGVKQLLEKKEGIFRKNMMAGPLPSTTILWLMVVSLG